MRRTKCGDVFCSIALKGGRKLLKKKLKGLSLFERISKEIPSQQNPRYKLTHKKTWLDLINKGIWPCDPQYLYRKMEEIISLDEYQPCGERLLFLRARDKFTLMPSRKPMRSEEALERLIVYANLDSMYGQIPLVAVRNPLILSNLKTEPALSSS